MPVFNLAFFDIGWISTDDPDGFNDNGGYQFDWGTSTVTITPGAESKLLQVEDTDASFDDDQVSNQKLFGDQLINGQVWPDDTVIEAEYEIIVQDSEGNQYTLQFVSLNEDAFTAHGFVIQGEAPPFGEPLTVVSNLDGSTGKYYYADSTSPACFAAGTRIATTRGPIPAEALRPGMVLELADGGEVRVEMILTSRTALSGRNEDAPIRIHAGAMGPDLPIRDLVLSPQHRVRLPGGGALAPARALTVLPRVGPMRGWLSVTYVHIITRTHAVILAEGLPCETFWPGDTVMAQLPHSAAQRILRIMGPFPDPAEPLIPTAQARRRLIG
ncbi:Hint domain-containing protein [Pseudooceanicola nanhaiensis]|uniref:Hint domain-containing protein n=1 Tax=Pseudooceanicola nanhaiensis TaxID=375761 RepID=UPI001CD7C8FA|nr:Hint domain-containing protein [Pseudooceanicola nanhaiensis]MCA0920916.1 Hint domain-containing protein [Pseudooceanicola nanhaiensis]